MTMHVSRSECLTPPEYARSRGIGIDKVLGFIHSGELLAVNLASKPHGRPRYILRPADIAVFEGRRMAKAGSPAVRRRHRTDDGTIQFF